MTEEKAKIFHEALRRGLVSEADKTDREFLKKVAEYIKYWNGNPLDAGEHTVVKFFKADGVTTKVSGHPIEDFAVLKEGTETWGWKHIWKKHKEDFRKFYARPDQLGRKLSDEELIQRIQEDMEDVLRYGSRAVDYDKEVVIYDYNGIKAFVSIKDSNMGSIQTARPALHG